MLQGMGTRHRRIATSKTTDLRKQENTLTDEHGDNVKLKKGAHLEVTVTAEKIRTTSLISDKPKTGSKKRPMVIVRQK
jgi:hypothetical protein